jgi:hypothetical protein
LRLAVSLFGAVEGEGDAGEESAMGRQVQRRHGGGTRDRRDVDLTLKRDMYICI